MRLRAATCSRVMRAGPDGVDLPDGRPVELATVPAGAPEEDVGRASMLQRVGALVDVEHDLPRRARLYLVVVAQRQDDLEVGEVDGPGVPVVDVPGEGAVADAVRGRASRSAVNATARADGVAVAALEVRAAHPPLQLGPAIATVDPPSEPRTPPVTRTARHTFPCTQLERGVQTNRRPDRGGRPWRGAWKAPTSRTARATRSVRAPGRPDGLGHPRPLLGDARLPHRPR